jgi:hypothetical protein
MPKKLMKWGGLAFLVYFVATRPDQAGGIVKAIVAGIGSIFDSLVTFLASSMPG